MRKFIHRALHTGRSKATAAYLAMVVLPLCVACFTAAGKILYWAILAGSVTEAAHGLLVGAPGVVLLLLGVWQYNRSHKDK